MIGCSQGERAKREKAKRRAVREDAHAVSIMIARVRVLAIARAY